jgi:hypothetical protein
MSHPAADDVNGLLYMSLRWLGTCSLLGRHELHRLESGLRQLTIDAEAEDAYALRCFANAVINYIEHYDDL